MREHVNARNVSKIMRKTADFLDGEPVEIRQCAAEWLDEFLEECYASDTFGTEGQLDPRGDHRSVK